MCHHRVKSARNSAVLLYHSRSITQKVNGDSCRPWCSNVPVKQGRSINYVTSSVRALAS